MGLAFCSALIQRWRSLVMYNDIEIGKIMNTWENRTSQIRFVQDIETGIRIIVYTK